MNSNNIINKIVNRKYKVLSLLGKGSFGEIYKGINVRTSEKVAIKIELISNNTKLLKNESKIYRYLHGIDGISELKWFGRDEIYNYMVLELLGETLQERYYQIELEEVCKIGKQILVLIQNIHNKGLIHRDIKPDNFLFGRPDNDEEDEIFLIDFGLCKTFVNDNAHVPMRELNNVIGNLTFASINNHNKREQSRRDDLESLGYVMIYLLVGNFKWSNLAINNSNRAKVNDLIKRCKEDIFKLYDLPNVLMDYMNYVKCLEFNERPDYEYLSEKLSI